MLPPLALLSPPHPRLNAAYYSLRRSGVSVLRELVTRCRRNQQLLLSEAHQAAYSCLMGNVLPSCGDLPTQVRRPSVVASCVSPCVLLSQWLGMFLHSNMDAGGAVIFCALLQVDLLEVLFRCAKPFGERAYHQHLSAQVRATAWQPW